MDHAYLVPMLGTHAWYPCLVPMLAAHTCRGADSVLAIRFLCPVHVFRRTDPIPFRLTSRFVLLESDEAGNPRSNPGSPPASDFMCLGVPQFDLDRPSPIVLAPCPSLPFSKSMCVELRHFLFYFLLVSIWLGSSVCAFLDVL